MLLSPVEGVSVLCQPVKLFKQANRILLWEPEGTSPFRTPNPASCSPWFFLLFLNAPVALHGTVSSQTEFMELIKLSFSSVQG